LAKRRQITPKRGVICSRDPFFVCTAEELETYSPRHSASSYQQCRARRTAVYRKYGAGGHARRTL